MQRVDGYYLYQVGFQVHPVMGFRGEFGNEPKPTTYEEAHLPVIIAEGALEPLLFRSIFKLKTSIQHGNTLLGTIRALKAKIEQGQPTDKLTIMDVYSIQSALLNFEAVLAAEFGTMDVYVVSQELGSSAVEYVVNFILAKFGGKRSEMERMIALLETAIKESGETSRAALDANVRVVELMAAHQRPATRLFVAPVGESCATASIGKTENGAIAIDKPTKDVILAPEPVEITDARVSQVLISELDMKTGGCRVFMENDDDPEHRVPCDITDPVARIANNPYVAAMKEQRWIGVRAKAQIKDGDIEKLYISEIAN